MTLKGTTLESGKKVGAYVDAGCAAIVIAVPADSMNGTGSGSGSGSGSGGAFLKPEDVAKMAKPILINPKVHDMVSDVEMSLDWILLGKRMDMKWKMIEFWSYSLPDVN